MQAKKLFMNQLQNKRSLVFFSHFELGWELFRWAGFVRQYKLNNPKIRVCAATRENRSDIYYGTADDIYTFNIKDDYVKYRANMYSLDYWPKREYDKLIGKIKTKFRTSYLVLPPKNTVGRNFFPKEQMDFNFTPRPENLKIIKDILSKHNGKIPICISPRHRIDSPKPTRNWPTQYWKDLFIRIRQTGKYLVFIVGGSASIVRPPKDRFFIVLDDIRAENTSNLGLTIEALKHSCLTIGQQSALPILSNYLGKKTIMWGHEKVRHQVIENPYNTKCIFFEEPTVQYNTNPKIIFKNILKET